MKVLYAVNLGCPKNQVDLETILGGLGSDVTTTEDLARADAALINTCAFIESAKTESIDTIFEIVAARQENPNLKIWVSGCLPQRYKDQLTELMPEVDQFFHSTDALVTLNQLKAFFQANTVGVHRHLLNPSNYAYVRIAEGCNNRCSYCAIPLIKGSYASRPLEDIVHEAEQFVQQGVKELVVIAQDTTFYGRDLNNSISLPDVLREVSRLPIPWIRLLYTHPAHWTDELIEVMAISENIVKYADIPIQHIADPVLKRMRRRVTRHEIERLIATLRHQIPDIAIRTSLITGFPGETEAHFQELLEFLETTRFERLGVFTYSHEEGTTAYRFADDVPTDVKLQRQRIITQLQEDIAEERNAQWIGKRMRVLVDEVDTAQNLALARGPWDAPEIDGNIYLPPSVIPGNFYDVKIKDAELYDLIGELA